MTKPIPSSLFSSEGSKSMEEIDQQCFFPKNHVEKELRYRYHFHINRINPV